MSSEHGWQRHYPHSLSSFHPFWIKHPSPYNLNLGGFIFAMTQINSPSAKRGQTRSRQISWEKAAICSESHHIRSWAYRWRTRNIRNDFTFSMQNTSAYFYLLGAVFLFPFWETLSLQWKFNGESSRPHKERTMLHVGHLWRGPPWQFPAKWVAGHTAIPRRTALTQVTVMLTICFNPTKIRVGNLKAFKEKKKNLVLPLTQAIFLQIFKVQRHCVFTFISNKKITLLYLITLLF